MENEIFNTFGIKIVSHYPFKRNDTDEVVNEILISDDGKEYFLKEIQPHSDREDFDNLYFSLNKVSVQNIHLILPIAHRFNDNHFVFKISEKNFLLFPKFKILPFEISKYPLDTLISKLKDFHIQIKEFQLEKQSYRNYESWLTMGAKRLRKKINFNCKFLDQFEFFLDGKFKEIHFLNGNIHWDIHRDNLGLNEVGELLLLDFDLVQEGCYLTDIAAAMSLYINWENFNENDFEMFCKNNLKYLKETAKNVSEEDLNFLIKRNMLGDLALIESLEEIKAKLNSFTLNLK